MKAIIEGFMLAVGVIAAAFGTATILLIWYRLFASTISWAWAPVLELLR